MEVVLAVGPNADGTVDVSKMTGVERTMALNARVAEYIVKHPEYSKQVEPGIFHMYEKYYSRNDTGEVRVFNISDNSKKLERVRTSVRL